MTSYSVEYEIQKWRNTDNHEFLHPEMQQTYVMMGECLFMCSSVWNITKNRPTDLNEMFREVAVLIVKDFLPHISIWITAYCLEDIS